MSVKRIKNHLEMARTINVIINNTKPSAIREDICNPAMRMKNGGKISGKELQKNMTVT